MLTVAVTGGIGAGKSTVSRMLGELGAVVVDSDQLARDVVAPGSDGLAAVVAEFGPELLAADGTMDRAAMARLVFSDAGARRRLEGIIHPLVRHAFTEIRDRAVATDPHAVVVNDIPLVRSAAEAAAFDEVIVVTAAEATRVSRLVGRGLDETDARARIAAQISDDERAALANVVIPNDGDRRGLAGEIHALWQRWHRSEA